MASTRIIFIHLAARRSVRTALHEKQLGDAQIDELMWIGAIYALPAVSRNWRIHADFTTLIDLTVRVHLQPRRFASGQYDWRKRIVMSEADWLVVHKPIDIPVHATLDNIRENVMAELSAILIQKLYVTHRLDYETEGLLLIARTVAGQRQLNRWLMHKRITRRYQAWTRQPLAQGAYIHYMHKTARAPQIVTAEPPGLCCQLTVRSCEPRSNFYLSEIELGSGRTHQIRAQLAALQNPLIGDTLYGGVVAARLGLYANYLELGPLGKTIRLPTVTDPSSLAR
jgi:23S rRNA-/tRNA-specific pseudouridylate synthase